MMKVSQTVFLFFKLELHHFLSAESSIIWRMGRSYTEYTIKSISSYMTLIVILKGIKAINIIQTKYILEH